MKCLKTILLAILVTTMILGVATTAQAISASDSAVVVLPGPVFSNTDIKLVKTEHAYIWSFQEIEIPEYLAENFDRIFIRLGRFFGVNVDDEMVLVFVVDFETLQKLYNHGSENPKVVAAFYDSKSNRIYFTPRYINEYYVTYELINYFWDEHRERTVPVLARFLVWQGLIEKSIVKEFILREGA